MAYLERSYEAALREIDSLKAENSGSLLVQTQQIKDIQRRLVDIERRDGDRRP